MYVLGVDIAKDTVVVCLMNRSGEILKLHKTEFANTIAGFREIVEILLEPSETHVLVESTGVYSELSIFALDGKVAAVYEINPCLLKKSATRMTQTKTDPADARSIAEFGLEWLSLRPQDLARFEASYDSDLADLKLLQQERQRKRREIGRLKNQIENLMYNTAPMKDVVMAEREEDLERLEKQAKKLNRRIEKKMDVVSSENADLLLSIPGIGPLTTAALLVRIRDIERFTDVDKLKAYLGIYPARKQSGKTEARGKMAKNGDAYVKHTLWNAARCARTHNPICKAYYEQLRNRGFSGPSAFSAVMRKLVHQVYGVLKSRAHFDPQIASKVGAHA